MSQATYDAVALYSQIGWAIVFIAVLVWAAAKYVGPAVMAAEAATNRRIAEAERHRDEAKAALAVLQMEIEGAARDASAIRTRSVDFAAHERDAALAEARAAGERALRNAAGELDRARAAAAESLRTELLEKALDLAKTDARARIEAGFGERLVTDFLKSIEKGSN